MHLADFWLIFAKMTEISRDRSARDKDFVLPPIDTKPMTFFEKLQHLINNINIWIIIG